MERAAKRSRTSTSSSTNNEGVSMLFSHPNGVMPLGNAPIEVDLVAQLQQLRRDSLGSLHIFSDDMLLHFFRFLRVEELCAMGKCSRFLYLFANHDDLWRKLVLARFIGDFEFDKTWKQTYSKRHSPNTTVGISTPLKVQGVFSDTLFTPWLLGTMQMQSDWIKTQSVDRRSQLSKADFEKEYETASRPVIITDVVPTWPAYTKWTDEHLIKCFGDNAVKVAGRNMTFENFLKYSNQNNDDRPLYLFDSRFANKSPSLAHDYSVPVYFQDDFFQHLGKTRPDYRFLIMGPTRSGSSFHVDPNGTCAWNAMIRGRKKWILYPPNVTPPGILPDGNTFSAKTSLTEWFIEYYDSIAEGPEEDRPLECVTEAGDIMFVPSGWWHCVINVEPSMAITHNVITEYNLLSALDVLNEPSSCDPKLCQGDKMGDVPLWVAMGGTATKPLVGDDDDENENDSDGDGNDVDNTNGVDTSGNANDDTSGLCLCEIQRRCLVQTLRTTIDQCRPGLLDNLERAREQEAAQREPLWHKLRENNSDTGSSFSFGF